MSDTEAVLSIVAMLLVTTLGMASIGKFIELFFRRK